MANTNAFSMLTRRAWLGHCVNAGSVLSSAALLTACGFELRKAPDLPFKSMFTNLAEGSAFGQLLKRNLKALGNIEIITDVREVERADVILDILEEAQEKVILSRTSTGTVREYTLRMRVRFKLRTRDGFDLIPNTELVQEREISFNETAALSKESEEALLYKDMENDLVQQIQRRLASIRQI